MPRYFYVAKTLKGEPRSGVLEAKSEKELAGILRQEDCILISANLAEKTTQKRKILSSINFFDRVSLTEKIMFARNLQVMVSAGISLPRALTILAEQAKSKKFRNALLNISEEIVRGRSLSEAASRHPSIFSELFVSMVKVGEESGTLEEVLGVLLGQMEKDRELKSKIKGAMIYPLVIVITMILIGIAMLILIVPKLAETFADLNIDLPFTTRTIIFIGNLLAKFWYLLPLITIIFLILLRVILKTQIGKAAIDKLVLKIPIISSIIKKTNSAYTVRNLGSLIASGVPIIRALEITSGTLGNIYYKKTIYEASEQIKKGSKLSQFLSQHQNIYPSLVVQMLAVGEETGKTADMLQKLADFYEEEVTQTTKNLSSLIEPVLMIIIGAIVGFFVISMIQPMYSMIKAF